MKKILRKLKQFLIATLIFVITVPSFASAVTAVVENVDDFSLRSTVSNIMLDVGMTTPHQNDFIVSVEKNTNKIIDSSVTNYKEKYSEGDVIKFDIKFVGTINGISDDTKMVFSFEPELSSEKVERVLTKENVNIIDENWIQFSYKIQGEQFDENGNMIDKGDNGKLVIEYLLGSVYFDENNSSCVFTLPGDVEQYEDKIIADTKSPNVRANTDGEYNIEVQFDDDVYKYVPGDVTETEDNRENGTIRDITASDIKLISNTNRYFSVDESYSNTSFAVLKDGEFEEKEETEMYIPVKSNGKIIYYLLKSENKREKAYIKVASKENDRFELIDVTSVCLGYGECCKCSDESVRYWISKENFEYAWETTNKSTYNYQNIMQNLISTSSDEIVTINDIVVGENVNEKNTAEFLYEGLKELIGFTDETGAIYDETRNTYYKKLEMYTDTIYYITENGFEGTSEAYRIYRDSSNIDVFYYNVCTGKYYISVSKDTKMNFISIDEFVEVDINDDECEEREMSFIGIPTGKNIDINMWYDEYGGYIHDELSDDIIQNGEKVLLLLRKHSEADWHYTIKFNITDMYLNEEFMEGLLIDSKTLKNENGIQLIGKTSSGSGEEKVYEWRTYINRGNEIILLNSKDSQKIESNVLLSEVKNYFKENNISSILEENGEKTRIISFTNEEISFYRSGDCIEGIVFDVIDNEYEFDDYHGTFTAYYNSNYSVIQPIICSKKDINNVTNFYYYDDLKSEIDSTTNIEQTGVDLENVDNINQYIDYNGNNTMFLNLEKIGELDKFENASSEIIFEGTRIAYKECEDENRKMEIYEGDEICIPTLVDSAGNYTGFHYRFDDGILEEIHESTEESEKYISPVIDIETNGVSYTDKIVKIGDEIGSLTEIRRWNMDHNPDIEYEIIGKRTVYYNKKGSKYTIKTLSQYKDGSVQIGFKNLTDPNKFSYEPLEYKDAKYISYDDNTGISTWEYEVQDGDQGELYVKINSCACSTKMHTAEKKDENENLISKERDFIAVEFNEYYADSIAPIIYKIYQDEDTEDNENYDTYSYEFYDDDGDRYGTDIYNSVMESTDTSEKANVKFACRVYDETKLDGTLAEKSYTSEDDPHFIYEDVYDNSDMYDRYTNYSSYTDIITNRNIQYKIRDIDYYASQGDTYGYGYGPNYRNYEKSTFIDTTKRTLSYWCNRDATVKYNYITGSWYENEDSKLINYSIGEGLTYGVSLKAIKEGIAKPVIKIKDYAGNESNYMINRLENGECEYLLIVDETSPDYEITSMPEKSNSEMIEFEIEYTDPTIDGYAGSGIFGSILYKLLTEYDDEVYTYLKRQAIGKLYSTLTAIWDGKNYEIYNMETDDLLEKCYPKPNISNGEIVDIQLVSADFTKDVDIKEMDSVNASTIRFKYKAIAKNDGNVMIYFDKEICSDAAHNYPVKQECKEIFVDTTAPIINDITGVPDEKTSSAEISVIAEDLSNIQYAFQLLPKGETLDNSKFVYGDSNRYTIQNNGILYISLKDELGNETQKSIEITNIAKENGENTDQDDGIVIFNTETEDRNIIKVIESEKNYVVIQPDVSLNDLLENNDVITEENIIIKNSKGTQEISENEKLATGEIMTFGDTGKEYVIAIKGDVNQDGKVSMLDIIKINKTRMSKIIISYEQKLASDTNQDGKISMLDIIRVNKYRLNKISRF